MTSHNNSQTDVNVIMGSISDAEVMEKACECLCSFEVSVTKSIVSAHRTPTYMQEYALGLKERGTKIVIAGAGGAAHLPGMVASLTTLPVIGVPIALKHLGGIDSLLSIVSMPKGVPVATVAVNNAFNAGLLAVRILSLGEPKLAKKLEDFANEQKAKSLESNKHL